MKKEQSQQEVTSGMSLTFLRNYIGTVRFRLGWTGRVFWPIATSV